MTNTHKEVLVGFLTRPGLYIRHVDQNEIVSFITGFEVGGSGKCHFTKLLAGYLEEKLAVTYSSDGWPGQILRYGLKKNISWVEAFTDISLEVIYLNGGFNAEIKKFIRTKVLALLSQVQQDGHPAFDRSWLETWNSICHLKSNWFANIWTAQELTGIRAIDKEVKHNKIFLDWKPFRPTEKLLSLSRNFSK